MTCLSLLLCLTLMFGVISKPLQAHAVVTEAAICYIIATIAISMAISVVVNHPKWGEACMDIYNNYISPYARQQIDSAVNTLKMIPTGYMFTYDWTRQAWYDITTGIINYMHDHPIDDIQGDDIIVSSSTGKIGFTSDTKFTLPINQLNSSHWMATNERRSFDLGKTTLRVGILDTTNLQANYPELFTNVSATTTGKVVELIYGDGFRFVDVFHPANYDASWYTPSSPESMTFRGTESDLRDYGLRFSRDNISLFRFVNNSENKSGYYDSNGIFYQLEQTDTGKWAFVSLYDYPNYNNLSFDNYSDAVLYLCNKAHIAVDFTHTNTATDNSDAVGVYTPGSSASDVPYTYDPTATDQALNDINSRIGDGTDGATGADSITTVLPTTDAGVDTLADNPALITDPAAAAVSTNFYPADLPKIDTGSPQLWTTKFPFCLPFDIYNLVNAFFVPSEMPQIRLLLMPQNSFGLQNPELYLDINLNRYQQIINLLRFFEGLSFTLFLIVITKRLIK